MTNMKRHSSFLGLPLNLNRYNGYYFPSNCSSKTYEVITHKRFCSRLGNRLKQNIEVVILKDGISTDDFNVWILSL